MFFSLVITLLCGTICAQCNNTSNLLGYGGPTERNDVDFLLDNIVD